MVFKNVCNLGASFLYLDFMTSINRNAQRYKIKIAFSEAENISQRNYAVKNLFLRLLENCLASGCLLL